MQVFFKISLKKLTTKPNLKSLGWAFIKIILINLIHMVLLK